MITSTAALTYLWIAVAVFLLVILYQVLFIVVDLRKIMRRVEDISAEVEQIIMKPISMADHILKWVTEMIEEKQKKSKSKKK